MAALLPSERAQFSALIDGILRKGDLATISAKQIRKALQAKLEVDISERKDVIKTLIMERFDAASAAVASPPSSPRHNSHALPNPTKKVKTETKVKNEDVKDEDSAVDSPSPKKKRKQEKNTKNLDDAQLAAMLQAEEDGRARPTRGGSTKRKTPVKKRAPKKKSNDKVKAEDDSELELDSNGEIKEKPKKGGFHKQYNLSAPLADLVGEATLSRPQVVKKIWEYIKGNELQDPADKRQILCDEKLQLVFKQDKVHMFTMNKLLGKQLYDIEE